MSNFTKGVKFWLGAVLMSTVAACENASADMSRTDVEEIVREFVQKNPDFILETLIEHQKSLAESQQAALEQENTERDPARIAQLNDFIANTNAPVIGDKNAPITIVEFFDYNCGVCRMAADWVFATVDAPPRDVRVIMVEAPIFGGAPSHVAARASLAADKQGKYRQFHAAMFKNQANSTADIMTIAESVGLDTQRLAKDMEAKDVYETLDANVKLTQELGIRGTPGFFVADRIIRGFDPQEIGKIVSSQRQDG